MKRGLKSRLKARAFAFAERRLGLHITPVHFYSPVPTVAELDPAISTTVKPCVGLDLDPEAQLALLKEKFPRYAAEYAPVANTGLAKVDAFVLYALLRDRKPGFMVEIGSGESTKVSLAALARNAAEGSPCRLMSIDPYPPAYLRAISTPGFELVVSKVQDVAVAAFAGADVLFIDSSHVSKIGSDVNYEILNLVPRVKVGCLVHWHDIMIPVDYPMEWINKGTFWNESYMVHAFMLHNDAFRTRWAARYMQTLHADALQAAFPYFDGADPSQQLSSFWIERVG